MGGKDLSTTRRNEIVQFLLQNSQNWKMPRGIMNEAVAKFGGCRRIVNHIWTDAKKQQESLGVIHSVNKRSSKEIRILKVLDVEALKALPVSQRTTIRSLADGLESKKGTVERWIKNGLIIPHTNAIKPHLTASNQVRRLMFSLLALERDINMKLQFKTMRDTVHIDEKWFYMKKTNKKFYLAANEVEPHRTCQSKNHIDKVMFMSAVARPLFNEDGSVLFDGKIGIFPFTEMVPAKRNSKNRPAGTMELKATQNINQQVIRNNFINGIVPGIKASWPEGANKVIYIQQDNARPHIKDSDPEFRAVASSNGFDIRIIHQPANSPDMNINDLGWFRAIQSMQQKSVSLNTEQLVEAVTQSFQNLEPEKLNKVFITLQTCLLEVMKVKGQTAYKIPHIGKDVAARADELPITLEASEDLVQECIEYLREQEGVEGFEELLQRLGMQENEE